MSNKGGKAGTNKFINLSRRLPGQGAPKRPLQGSPAGPPSKKPPNSIPGTSIGARKPEEGSKDKKPLFQLPPDWKDLVGTDSITGSGFDVKKDEMVKNNEIEKFVLISLRSLADSSRGDVELTQKILQYVISECQTLKSVHVLQGLFESFSFVDGKENFSLICQAISTVFNSFEHISPFMFKLVMNDSCGKRSWVDSPEAAPIYYGIMSAFGSFVVPSEELYEKAEFVPFKRSYVNITALEKKINPESEEFKELIPTTLNLISQRCQEEPTKSVIRTVAFLVNNSEIRSIILKKLDTWLQAISLQRCVPENILFLCVNTPTLSDENSVQTAKDLLVLHSLQKKQHQTVLLACLDYWLNFDRKNLDTLVSIILDLEFSPKQQQKMPHLYVFLQYLYFKNAEETSKIIANKLVAALINPKTVRLVRNFLKEFTKAGFRVDFQFGILAKYIFEGVRVRINQRELFNDDFNAIDLLKNAINICSILPITAVSTSIKDAGNIRRSGGNLNAFQSSSLNSEERKAALNAIQNLIGDESTKISKIESLSKLPAFDVYKEYICRELSYAITIESDMERILNLIGFIMKHGSKEGDIIHVVAMRLTMIIERVGSGDTVAHRNVQNLLLEFFVNYLTKASEGEKPPFGSSDFDYGEPLKVKIPKFSKEFVISSKVLTGMMTLLCEGSDEGTKNKNREFLLNALFGDEKQKLKVVRVSDGSKIDVLPEELRKRMLTSADERIVKAALDGMNVERALQFLQSFAITAIAYSKLLDLVNSSKPPIEEAKKAAIFVRAYKLKGAKGADEFLNYVEQESITDEKPLKKIILDSLPKFEISGFKLSLDNPDISNPSEAVKILNDMCNSKFLPMEIVLRNDWKAYTVSLKNIEIAKECLNFISKIDSDDFHFCVKMTILSIIDEARNNEEYRKIIASLKNSRIGQHPDFKPFIEKYANTVSKGSTKKEFQNADEILKELSKNGGNLPPHVLNNLLSRFRRFRPEIVNAGLNEMDFQTQVFELFKNDNSAIRNLIETLAASTLQSTVKKVVNCLLQKFEISVSPVLVIEFIDKCVRTQEEDKKVVPTANQCIVLIDYVISDMAFERPSSTVVPQFLIVLEAVMDEYDVKKS